MNYYEHHLGDYAEATAHLSFVEDAAYSRLIRKVYATERPLPRDVKDVQRLVGARTPPERAAVQAMLREFFVLREDGWHNDRCDEEIAKYQAGEPERQAKRANEESRLKRHREERTRLFEALRAVGQAPNWNIKMEDLKRLHERFCNGPETPPETFQAHSPATAPATPATATQTPVPLPSPQTPDTNPNPVRTSDARADRKQRPGATDAPPALSPDFERFLAETYPATAHRRDLVTALHSAMGIVGMGKATEADLRRRLTGFRAFADAGGYSDPSKVPTPQRWFQPHQQGEPYWAREWEAPAPIKPVKPEPVRTWRPDDEPEAAHAHA
ncbi:MAG: hypothetical protein RLZZ200_521 [Pseudomonadota bacterium]|jgi:uncharacterized protein YdaU (DUF1376 family)